MAIPLNLHLRGDQVDPLTATQHDDNMNSIQSGVSQLDTTVSGITSYPVADSDKLAAIESAADVTDAINVESAGAVMTTSVGAANGVASLDASGIVPTTQLPPPTGGDMLQSVYDTNGNGIVDNSTLTNGFSIETAVPVGAVFTDTTYSITSDIEDVGTALDKVWSSAKVDEKTTISPLDFSAILDETVISGYDIAGASYDSESLPLSDYNSSFCFNDVGTKYYELRNDSVYEYALSFPYKVSSAVATGASFAFTTQATSIRGIDFNTTGTKLIAVGSGDDTVYGYDLSTAFSISTLVYAGESFSVIAQTSTPFNVRFNTNGTKVYIGKFLTGIFQYTLSSALNVATMTYDNISLSVSDLKDFVFNAAGTKLLTTRANFASSIYGVYEYDMTSDDLSTASYSGVFHSTLAEIEAPGALAFSNGGAKMFVTGTNYGDDNIFQYSTGEVQYIDTTQKALNELDIHTHTTATTSYDNTIAGILTATNAQDAIDEVAAGTSTYIHPIGDGNLHVPANSTTNSGRVLTATAVAGVYEWVTIPGGGDMLQSTYDINSSGVVDNAELVSGYTVGTAVPAGALFTDTVYDVTSDIDDTLVAIDKLWSSDKINGLTNNYYPITQTYSSSEVDTLLLNIAKTNVINTFTVPQREGVATVVSAATINLDMDVIGHATISLGTVATITATNIPTDIQAETQSGVIRIVQTTGNHAVTFGSGTKLLNTDSSDLTAGAYNLFSYYIANGKVCFNFAGTA